MQSRVVVDKGAQRRNHGCRIVKARRARVGNADKPPQALDESNSNPVDVSSDSEPDDFQEQVSLARMTRARITG